MVSTKQSVAIPSRIKRIKIPESLSGQRLSALGPTRSRHIALIPKTLTGLKIRIQIHFL
jgi:hypothetical protein